MLWLVLLAAALAALQLGTGVLERVRRPWEMFGRGAAPRLTVVNRCPATLELTSAATAPLRVASGAQAHATAAADLTLRRSDGQRLVAAVGEATVSATQLVIPAAQAAALGELIACPFD